LFLEQKKKKRKRKQKEKQKVAKRGEDESRGECGRPLGRGWSRKQGRTLENVFNKLILS
jgi:hypothetical protein